jgi:hypothetical protein
MKTQKQKYEKEQSATMTSVHGNKNHEEMKRGKQKSCKT